MKRLFAACTGFGVLCVILIVPFFLFQPEVSIAEENGPGLRTIPTIKLVIPKSGIAWSRHPKCPATGRSLELTIEVADLESDATIYPVVRGGRKLYPKEPFQPAGSYHISQDGYGNPGNVDQHQEVVFFVLVKRSAKQAMDRGLHGVGIDSLPAGATNLDKAPTVLVKIMSVRDCNRPLPQ